MYICERAWLTCLRMQHSPLEAHTSSTSLEIPQILWNPNIHVYMYVCVGMFITVSTSNLSFDRLLMMMMYSGVSLEVTRIVNNKHHQSVYLYK